MIPTIDNHHTFHFACDRLVIYYCPQKKCLFADTVFSVMNKINCPQNSEDNF
jgi:hypothetical protein